MTGRRLSLILALAIFFSVNANAATTLPVVVQVLPGSNIIFRVIREP